MLILALLPLAALPGCGKGQGPSARFIVRQNGVVIGAENVTIVTRGDIVTYEGRQERPFEVFDTEVLRRETVGEDGETLETYFERRSENGAVLRTYMKREGDSYSYLQNNLQTFDYVPALLKGRRPYPLERDSVCLAQAFLDRFLASKLADARALIVVPSAGPILREVLIKGTGEDRVTVGGEGFGDIELTYSEDGLIQKLMSKQDGIEIAPGSEGAMRSRQYAPAEFEVKEVRVPTEDKKELAGSFYVPRGKGPFKAVAIEPDVGPQDRTGAGVLSQLAESLAGSGIAVLVCDKRGIGDSGGDYGAYTLGSAASDFNSQIDFLTMRDDVDIKHIGAVGYGEGGLAAAIAAADNPYVTACALVAAPSVRMFPDLMERRIGEGVRSGSLSQADAVTQLVVLNNMIDVFNQNEGAGEYAELQGHRVFLGWLRSHFGSDPPVTYSSLKVPVLVAQGTADEFVTPGAAAEIMKVLEARPGGKQRLALFDGLGHGLGKDVDEARAKPYRSHPKVDGAVLKAVSDFFKEQLGAR